MTHTVCVFNAGKGGLHVSKPAATLCRERAAGAWVPQKCTLLLGAVIIAHAILRMRLYNNGPCCW